MQECVLPGVSEKAGMEMDGVCSTPLREGAEAGLSRSGERPVEDLKQVKVGGSEAKKMRSSFKRRPREVGKSKGEQYSSPSVSRKRGGEEVGGEEEVKKKAKLQFVSAEVEMGEENSLLAGLHGQPGRSK